jgi:hypothetical protein
VSRLSVELHAIFARDGRAVKQLEKTSFNEALHNGKLSARWTKNQIVSLEMVRLKQVARPESLSTNALGPPASKSHQLEAGTAQRSSATGSQQPEDTNSRNSSILRSQQDEATDSDVSPTHASETPHRSSMTPCTRILRHLSVFSTSIIVGSTSCAAAKTNDPYPSRSSAHAF